MRNIECIALNAKMFLLHQTFRHKFQPLFMYLFKFESQRPPYDTTILVFLLLFRRTGAHYRTGATVPKMRIQATPLSVTPVTVTPRLEWQLEHIPTHTIVKSPRLQWQFSLVTNDFSYTTKNDWLKWHPTYSDTFGWSRGCHCKPGGLYSNCSGWGCGGPQKAK